MKLSEEESEKLWEACVEWANDKSGCTSLACWPLGNVIKWIRTSHKPKSIWWCEEHQAIKNQHFIFKGEPCEFVEYIPKGEK